MNPRSPHLHASCWADNLSTPIPHLPCFQVISRSKESLPMKKLSAVTLTIALAALTIAVNARTINADIPAPPAIGATISDFTLSDAAGKEHSLSSLKGKNGTVLIFVAVQCPISNAYNERMEKLAQDYKARGISVIGINSNAPEAGDAVKKHAEENKLTFPVLKDH